MSKALRRRYGHSRMSCDDGVVDTSATASLARLKPAARNRGDLNSAVMSAAYYAKKQNKTMFVYVGNSYGHQVWRVASSASEYLNPINNTGTKMLSVSPDGTVRTHSVTRDG